MQELFPFVQITTKKMDISEEQRLAVLEVINKLAHSRSEAKAQEHYQQLQDFQFEKV